MPGAVSGLFGDAVGFLVGGAATVATVCFFGWLLFAFFGAGDAGARVFVGMPLRGFGALVRWAMTGFGWVVGKGVERAAFEAVDLPARLGRLRNPDMPLVKVEERRPLAPPREELRNGRWRALGRTYEAVHAVYIAGPGAGKDQAGFLASAKAQLESSEEHLVFIDPKRELRRYLERFLRPDDRLFVYSFSRDTPLSSALAPAWDEEAAADVGAFLIPEDGNEGHWARSGQRLFGLVEAAVCEDKGGVRPTLLEIFDVMADPDAFDDLCRRHPRIKRVAPNEREFGSVYSTAMARLGQLRYPRVRRVFDSRPRVRRVFAGDSGTEQPDLSGRSGRTVIFIEPDPRAGVRLNKYVALCADHVFQLAAAAGEAGGPGTKVFVDEAASYMRLEKLPSYLEIGRGYGVQIAYVLQSFSQLKAVLGDDEAKQCLASTDLHIVGAGSDTETAHTISELSGRARVAYAGPRQRDWDRRREEMLRPVVNPEHVYGLAKGEWIVRLGPRVEMARVPERHYFVSELGLPDRWGEREIHGVVEEATPEPEPDHDGHDRDAHDHDDPPREVPGGEPNGKSDREPNGRVYRKPPRRPGRSPKPQGEPVRDEEATRCANCGEENPAGRKACRRCLKKLKRPTTGEDPAA